MWFGFLRSHSGVVLQLLYIHLFKVAAHLALVLIEIYTALMTVNGCKIVLYRTVRPSYPYFPVTVMAGAPTVKFTAVTVYGYGSP
jgi:hypothetical protein